MKSDLLFLKLSGNVKAMTREKKDPHSSAYMLTLKPRLSNRQRSFLNIAVKAAGSSEIGKWKHGAVVVKSGRVLSIGVNKQRNAEMQTYAKDYETCFTVHAEIDALARVPKREQRGATIYVARVNVNGEERLSRPCENCEEALVAAGIKNVIFTV